jgi:hypothetical protein
MWQRPERRSPMSLAARAWWVARRDADALEEELQAERAKRFARRRRLRAIEEALEQAREIERSCVAALGAPSLMR